jgi:hypothetical protein
MSKYKNDDIQDCISKIINENENRKICPDVSEQDIKNCVNEVYSDLYAINCYSVNYFFAFFFCQMGDDASIDKMNSYSFLAHPPSIIRTEYMKKELEKRGYLDESDSLKNIMLYHKPYLQNKEVKIKALFEKYQPIHDLIYENVSLLFDKYKGYHFEKKEIALLCNFLDGKMPIGTYCKKKKGSKEIREIMELKEIREIMENREKNFNLDSETKIIDIIYAGWSYLISNLFQKLYNEPKKYPVISKLDDENTFYKDYNFFIKNINYSIETSVIVSSYLGDHDV